MTVVEGLAGALPSYRVRLDRGAIRRFATAVGATDAVHHDVEAARAAGHPDLVAPPTYLFGLDLEHGRVFRLLGEAGLDPASCLHVEQEFAYGSSPHAGETLVFRPRFVPPPVARRGAMRFVQRRTAVDRSDGEPVAVLRQLIAVRSSRAGEEAA
ncbi:MaoC family dehydratase N-terminal domain-containing protein [Streptomyces sp. CNQ085]|uniref:FAS1-like dehydratase domain-containing protein n=1 Tax=Streptomyces sp. CNQ085 TaxID=2886944 RepID=UPI001F50D5AD|nr:MaoC family dehydratase N-terminal domain-containing protein [Streptomyces sp. CNQ085]MCI0385836.1 MaoC family dehydratase N-terminal domain-containing protein [Streptomyces sp. CNQ085]